MVAVVGLEEGRFEWLPRKMGLGNLVLLGM